jgi:hypothetical protein
MQDNQPVTRPQGWQPIVIQKHVFDELRHTESEFIFQTSNGTKISIDI